MAKSTTPPVTPDGLADTNPRGEVAACPTGIGTGQDLPIDPSPNPTPPASPGEGITEKEIAEAESSKKVSP